MKLKLLTIQLCKIKWMIKFLISHLPKRIIPVAGQPMVAVEFSVSADHNVCRQDQRYSPQPFLFWVFSLVLQQEASLRCASEILSPQDSWVKFD